MLIDASQDYIYRVNGIPLYYSSSTIPVNTYFKEFCTIPQYSPYATPSPPCDTSMTSKIIPSQHNSLSPPPLITLTPPLSPFNTSNAITTSSNQSRRGSVIMKVENCQITPANDNQQISIDHVCRWENCYRIFDTLEKLANHVSVMHSNVAPDNLYYCKWESCTRSDRGFNARYKMLVHCRTHTKEKPHRCTFANCGKSFSRAENLKIHIRSHTLEKPYKCNFPGCTKAYSNSSDRFKHNRTHLNNKPYCCKFEGCGKRYTDPSSLRKHVKTFNHESLIAQQKLMQFGAAAVNIKRSDNDFDFKVSQKLLNATNYNHKEVQRGNDGEIYKNYCVELDYCQNDKFSDFTLVEEKMETFNINEPLDLRISNKKFDFN